MEEERRVAHMGQDEAGVDEFHVVGRPAFRDIGGFDPTCVRPALAASSRARASLSCVEIDAENPAVDAHPARQLEGDVATAASDVDDACTLDRADTVKQTRRRRCEHPADDLEPLAALLTAADDVVVEFRPVVGAGRAPVASQHGSDGQPNSAL